MMWKEEVSRTYSIKVLVENFFTIMDKDGEAIVNDEKTLFNLLDGLSFVEKVEYEGMFGSIIWITLDVEADTKENWKTIESIIKDYIGSEVV